MSIVTQAGAAGAPPINRYKNAPRNADFTIDQDWASYTPAEHDRWDRLFARSRRILAERRSALLLIEERMSEFVEYNEIPLQLIKNKRRTEAQIAELEQKLGLQEG